MEFTTKDIGAWETGELGASSDSVAVSSDSVALDEALGMQLISIRLQKKLINDLKRIAGHHGIGYQPMIRDLLNRFVNSELKLILNDELRQLDQALSEIESTEPVRQFMEVRKQA